MIKFVPFMAALALFLISAPAPAYPEFIRHGYSSCISCHVSPTGGGALTSYGREASEEFMYTWKTEKAANFLHGAVTIPEQLSIGGDIRFLSLHRDNRIAESNVGFPMQVDFEAAYKFFDGLTVDAALGAYSGDIDSHRYYLLYQANENFFMRVGRFFPAYGIHHPDHSILTRRLLKFDQNQETHNIELGYLNENLELMVDVTSGHMYEEVRRDDGYSLRFASYISSGHQLGFSVLHGEGSIWQRDAHGVFALLSLGKKGFFESEFDVQSRKALDPTDASLPANKAYVSFNRLLWELFRGFQVFATLETLNPESNGYLKRQRSYGPGIQWFPRPHLEFMAKLEKKLDEAYSRDYGNQALLVSHYSF